MKKILCILSVIVIGIVGTGCRCTGLAGSPAPANITFDFISKTKDSLELRSMISAMKILVNDKEYEFSTKYVDKDAVFVERGPHDVYVTSISYYTNKEEIPKNAVMYKSYAKFTVEDNLSNIIAEAGNTIEFIFGSGKKIEVQFDTYQEILTTKCYEGTRLIRKNNFKVSSSGKELTFFTKITGEKDRYPYVIIEI